MKLSARNRAVGTVVSVEEGAIAALVRIEVREPFTVTSMITKDAAEDLKLKKGDKVSVIVKATEVIIAKD
ncbi:MAG TPA: TOBE domain-containing protein [Conexivisphaerales archaeon]|nr:TOBE domain-containing protein [Conexivisphaerales archaeon]